MRHSVWNNDTNFARAAAKAKTACAKTCDMKSLE